MRCSAAISVTLIVGVAAASAVLAAVAIANTAATPD
jgi:hypothetical protein